jgi:hypothetical protein
MKAVADATLARIAAHPVATSRLSTALGKAVKVGASSEGALALAGAGALYGIGKELITEYGHQQQQSAMKEKGYTEISATGTRTYLPGQPKLAESTRHSVSHSHGSPLGTLSDPYSKAAATPSLPGQQSPLPLSGYAPGRWVVEPKQITPSTTKTAVIAALSSAIPPTRRTYIKVPRFRIPKDRPYDLVKWEAATQAIANNMMANASED